MRLGVIAGAPGKVETPLLVLPWCQDSERSPERPSPEFDALDETLALALTRAVSAGDFRARRGETLLLYRSGEEGPDRVLLVGTGRREDLDARRLREVGGHAAGRAAELTIGEMTVALSSEWLRGAVGVEPAAQALMEGIVLKHWQFTEMKSERDELDRRVQLDSVTLLVPTGSVEEAALSGGRRGQVLASAQNYARELAIRPGNVVNPRYLADESVRLGKEWGLKVRVLNREAIRKDGMAAVLAVAAGSDEEPRFIAIQYDGGGEDRPLVLVGKGVTFDSGGLSLKTPQNMETMKYDMAGAASVMGAIRAIAELQLPANVVGLIPAVENLPSGHALRPGDVIGSRSRKTIEVINTDAEGRLILADALSYAARYEPAALVDIATLTGACAIALGKEAIGLMGTDEKLIGELREAGDRCGERVWPLPLWDDYRELLKSDVADIKNAGGRQAATITAALFLREFVGSFPWAHLDIAGTAWAEKAGPYQPVGPTGVGVRLFTEWVRGRTT